MLWTTLSLMSTYPRNPRLGRTKRHRLNRLSTRNWTKQRSPVQGTDSAAKERYRSSCFASTSDDLPGVSPASRRKKRSAELRVQIRSVAPSNTRMQVTTMTALPARLRHPDQLLV